MTTDSKDILDEKRKYYLEDVHLEIDEQFKRELSELNSEFVDKFYPKIIDLINTGIVEIQKWRKDPKIILVNKIVADLLREVGKTTFFGNYHQYHTYTGDDLFLGEIHGLRVLEVESLADDEFVRVF